MPVRALVSKSSTVKLFTTKYLSFSPEASEVPLSVVDPDSVTCEPEVACEIGVAGAEEDVGPTGTAVVLLAAVRRSRQTRRTP